MATTSGTVNGGTPGLTNGSGTTVCISQLDWIRSETETAVTYTLGVYIYCVRYGYSTSSVLSTSLACPGQTTRSTTNGSCDLSAGGRAKLSGNWTYTFQKTTSNYTRTIGFAVTSTGASVSGTSSGSLSVSVPHLTSHKVSYNSNGGSGSIGQQTKYYGTNITLSNGSAFTRTNHTLTGWNTKADGTGTAYALGATYTVNSTTDITLFAQWHMDYIKPTITNAKAYRVNNSSSSEPHDDGTYIYTSFSYTGGKQPSDPSYTPPSYILSINGNEVSRGTLSASGDWPTSAIAYGTYATNESHSVSIKLYDTTYDPEGITVSLTVGLSVFPIDLLAANDGTYMGIMTAARPGHILSMPSAEVLGQVSADSVSSLSIVINGSTMVDFVVAQSQKSVTDFGTGYWRWREWKSGKVEIWYFGSVKLDTIGGTGQVGGLYRYLRRITFPNNYRLYKCMGIVNGTLAGGWLNCGGLFNSSDVHSEPFTKIEVMAYRISSRPDQTQDNVHIYICGQKTAN